MHSFNPSTLEAEAGGSLWVQGQPGLQNEFQNSQGYIAKTWLKKKKKKKKLKTNKKNKLKRQNNSPKYKTTKDIERDISRCQQLLLEDRGLRLKVLYLKREKLQVPFVLSSKTQNTCEVWVSANVTGVHFPSRHPLQCRGESTAQPVGKQGLGGPRK